MTIIQLEKNELEDLVKNCVRSVMAENNRPAPPLQDNISLDEAREIIGTKEKPASKGTIYKMTMNGEIPFSKFGKRLVFSRKALIEWVESKTMNPKQVPDPVAQRVADTAKKQLKK